MNKIITIGREFGSGGRELGKRLADKLQCAYYDNEIVSEIAKKTELAESYIERVVEHRPVMPFPITVGRSFYPTTDPALDLNNSIYIEQSNILRDMAEKSDCVIVGRCADYVLRDLNPFRIFVYADMESRLTRCRAKAPEDENLTDKELKQKIQSIDKGRAKYYQFFTGRKWSSKHNYDLCINTSNRDIKGMAEAISKLSNN